MSRAQREPVSLFTVWKPGIVLNKGKPLVYQGNQYVDKRKTAQGNNAQSGQVPSKTAGTLAALANYQPPYLAHQNKGK